MKGVILAGGSGTRLQPITHTTQKQLVPIANKPVIQHVIEDLQEVGITEIGIVVGGEFPEEVRHFLGDGSRFGVEITYIFQGEPLGLAHAVGCTEQFVEDESFVVYFGDTILGDGITTTLVESFKSNRHELGLVLQRVEDPSRFGVVDMHDGQISRILEKPDDPPSELAYVGVVAFTPSVFQYIEAQTPSWRGELELTQVLHEMVGDGCNVNWNIVEGLWKDVGTPEDVIDTNRILQDELEHEVQGEIQDGADVTGPVKLGEGSIIEASATVSGPVVIGEGTRIGPGAHVHDCASIGDECAITESRVSSTVVMDGAEITGKQSVKDSVIGPESAVHGQDKNHPKQYILGRNSVVK